MPKPPAYGRPDGDSDLRQYARLAAATFGAELEAMEGWVRNQGADSVRVLRGPQGLHAGLTCFSMGQYFGGRSVPCWGLAGVAIPAHGRGQGRGRELLTRNLREQFEQGPPIAALYPASTALYRKLGYEQAGARITLKLRPLELPPVAGDLEVRAIEAADWATVRQVYARARSTENGCLDRNEELWERRRRVPPTQLMQGAIFENRGQAEGYLLFTLTRPAGQLRLQMQVYDWAFCTPAGRDALIAQLYGQRSVVEEITMQVAPNDGLFHGVIHDQKVGAAETMLWMLRIVRVQEALAARGWPQVNCEAAFSLIDENIPENRGHWHLRIKNGQAEVERARRADTGLHIRGLAALYSGYMNPAALRRVGLLEGSDKHDGALAAMFAGAAPWMLDYF